MTAKRAAQLPADWQPPPAYIDAGYELGLTRAEAREQALEMRDWALGKGEAKKDWLAAFRNWCRREAKRMDRQPRTEQQEPMFGGEQLNPGAQAWQTATGRVKSMLEALSGVGVSDEVLTELFREGVGITDINCPREMPTAVIKTDQGIKLWLRAIGGKKYGPNSYACRAGFNAIPYTKGYIERKREREA